MRGEAVLRTSGGRLRQMWLGVAGSASIMTGYALLGLAYGGDEWGLTFWTSALGSLVAAIGFGLGWRLVSAIGLLVGALGAGNAVRLMAAFPAAVDITALTLVALGLVAASVVLFLRESGALRMGAAHGTLLGALGGLVYLVHDVGKGISNQYVPDGAWLAGFLLLWLALRRPPS